MRRIIVSEFETYVIPNLSDPHKQDTHKGCLYMAESRDVEAPLVGVLVPYATSLGGDRKFRMIRDSGQRNGARNKLNVRLISKDWR